MILSKTGSLYRQPNLFSLFLSISSALEHELKTHISGVLKTVYLLLVQIGCFHIFKKFFNSATNHTLPYRYGAERGIHTFHFIAKGGVILKPSDFQKTIQCQFDCKLKKVVKGIVRNYRKELARRQAKEVSFCELPEIVVEKLIVLLAYHVRSEIMAKDPIKKADNGTYYFRANLGYNPITGKQIQKYRSGFRTKKEAKEEYSKLVLASTEELTTKKDGVSFQQFIEETYLPWYKTQVKESTYLNRATTIKKHFSYFYKMETDEIEPIHVQNWQLKLAKDFSPNYIRIVQGMLSIAFDRAIVLGIAKKNPSRMIGNIKSKKTKVDFWTLEEFQKVISLLCKKDYYEHYLFISFWLLFMTGMRIGEASALHWSDIDFETGLLSITKTLYYRTMTDYKFVEPKTQASIRTIYIDSDTLNELKAWQSVQQQVLPDCPLVLSYNGTPTSKTTLPRALEKLSNLAGVHRIKIHALRHSHASLLISMGENPLLIKERLGHEKIQTTLGTYGHLYPNTNLEVAKKLTGILQVQSATESIANYTSNQHTAIYHRTVEKK